MAAIETIDAASRQLISKLEVTRGTFLAPVASTDFDIKTYDLGDCSVDLGHDGGVDMADGTFKTSKSYSGKKSAKLTFKTDFCWSGTLATAPKWWKYMRACGFIIDTTGAAAIAKWTGRPNCQSLSMYYKNWQCGTDPKGMAEVIAGAAGSFELNADSVGAVIRAAFNFTGKYGGRIVNETALDFVLPSSFDTADTEQFLGATVTVGGTTYAANSFQLTQGADVQVIEDSADTTNSVKTGIGYYAVKKAKPQLTLQKLRVLKSVNDPMAESIANTIYSTVVIELLHFTITLSVAQAIDVQDETANESKADKIVLKIDEIEIKQKA